MKSSGRKDILSCRTCKKTIDREAAHRFNGRCETCAQAIKQRKAEPGWYERMQREEHYTYLMRIQSAKLRPADKKVLADNIKPDEYRTFYCSKCKLVRLDSKTLERHGKTSEDIDKMVNRACRRCGQRGGILAKEEQMLQVTFDEITPASFFDPLTEVLMPMLLEWGCFQWGFTVFEPEEAAEMMDHHKYRIMEGLADGCSILCGNGLLISLTRENRQLLVSGPKPILAEFRTKWAKVGGHGHWEKA